MTDEVEVQEEEQSAFEAGFSGAPAEQAATPESEQVTAEDEPVEEVAEEPEQPSEVQLLKDEVQALRSLMEQNTAKVHGKLGEAFRTLGQLQERKQAVGVEITNDDLDEVLRDEFPELGAGVINTLKKVMAKSLGGVSEAPAAPAFDESVIDKRIEVKARSIKEETLSALHPDWQQVRDSQEFRTWVDVQPDEVKQQISESQDIGFAVRMLSSFKDHQAKSVASTKKKTARLEQAVAPKGVSPASPPALDDEAAFLSGFKSARGG